MKKHVLYAISILMFGAMCFYSCSQEEPATSGQQGGSDPTPTPPTPPSSTYSYTIPENLPLLPSNTSLSGKTTVKALPKSAKRGVSFSVKNTDDAKVLADFISWDYNWGNKVDVDEVANYFDQHNVDFCPMCWNAGYSESTIRNFVKAHPNTKYLLGFNEPNLKDQANMTPSKAAESWPKVVSLAKDLGLKLVSPAMNYGTVSGYGDPLKWLDEFFKKENCGLETVDAIAIHCYMQYPSAAQWFVEQFEKYNKPIWLTEFCAWEDVPDVAWQKAYCIEMLNYLERQKSVERYAWFIPRGSDATTNKPYNKLLERNSPELTALGRIYAGVPAYRPDLLINANQPVTANSYLEYYDAALDLAPTTDKYEGLQLTLEDEHYVMYQVDVPTKANTFRIRYAAAKPVSLNIFVDNDGEPYYTVSLPATGSVSTWQTFALRNFPIQGKHTIYLQVTPGSVNPLTFGWFDFVNL